MTEYEILINPREATEIVVTQDTKNVEDILIKQSKQQSYQTAEFVLIDKDKVHYNNITIGSGIEITIDSELEFEGFVSNKQTQFAGDIILQLQCTGRTFELERYMTSSTSSYATMKTAAIAYDLLDTYTTLGDFGYADIDTNDGVTVQAISFDSETLGTCFRKLTEFDGYNYYVGNRRRV